MKSDRTVLHVINHTHWDREWFVPYTFTRRWLPNLIHNLNKVAKDNHNYGFLFDGQTQVIDDLEATDKATYDIARHLIKDKILEIGPYYVQVEMRNPGPESLIRNLRIGTTRARELGGSTKFTAWGVDYFGHVGQSPQIHGLFGIHDVYLWRGPKEPVPFFWWTGSDGTKMLAINLFAGGYRNFYKVASQDRLALPRLHHEVQKLRPFYKEGHIPVFDGFDLDKEPGDAATYFAEHHQSELRAERIKVTNSSPFDFAQTIRKLGKNLPKMKGELISGKYSSVFPGTLSARIYSKLLSAHAEQLLYRYAEPISLLLPSSKYPEQLFEDQTKNILHNLVHDVISGCSIDQVHDFAELRTAEVEQVTNRQVEQTLGAVSGALKNGVYAFVPSTGATHEVLPAGGQLYEIKSQGVGIAQATPKASLKVAPRRVKRFHWKNAHYETTLGQDGALSLEGGSFGQLVVRADDGDTYWDEPLGDIINLEITGPIQVMREAEGFAELFFTATYKAADFSAIVHATLTLDESPLIKWRLRVQTTGTGYTLSLRHGYTAELSNLNVGMQFDNVERGFEDTSLMPGDLGPKMNAVLIGQRDLYQTFTFPFQSYISPADGAAKVHLLAKGLRAYQTARPGNIDLVLARPVEWVMRPGPHKYHSGDAGPKFLVPGARSERETVIECAVLVSSTGPADIRFHQAVDRFINPPLLFKVTGSAGNAAALPLFDDQAPITSLHQYQGTRLVRLFNPTRKTVRLQRPLPTITSDETHEPDTSVLTPKRIATLKVESTDSTKAGRRKANVALLNWPSTPVGPDHSAPSKQALAQLAEMQDRLQRQLDSLRDIIELYGADAPNSLLHRYYVVARECMEIKLTAKWNELRNRGQFAHSPRTPKIDEKLYELATEYNDMRSIRRVYDYIVDIDEIGEEVARPTHHALKPDANKKV